MVNGDLLHRRTIERKGKICNSAFCNFHIKVKYEYDSPFALKLPHDLRFTINLRPVWFEIFLAKSPSNLSWAT